MHESISFGSDEWEPMPESDLSSQIRNNWIPPDIQKKKKTEGSAIR